MKPTLALLLICFVLVGCDSFFMRRVELLPDRRADGNLEMPDVSRVKSAVRAFALDMKLECTEGGTTLIIECHRQPITVWAVQMRNSVAVCFDAIGVPFETRKYSERMEKMQNLLTKEFGQAAVRVVKDGCSSVYPHT
jgi:hypothetical protein